MRQSLRFGSISGIPIGINWGLLLIALFYLFNLGAGILPTAVPGASALAYWGFAAVGVLAFFGSILAHELGHSIVAQRNGIRVRAITLWFLGGVAQLEKEADDPGVEFRIAIAGPAVSVALAVMFAGLTYAVTTLVGGGVFAFTLGYLAFINVALAVFNMIPAAPRDGGRVLAAALWRRSNNRHAARATAARVGEIFGTVLLVGGVFGVLMGAGTFILAILGLFLRTAASAEKRRAQTRNAIQHTTVADSMVPIVAPITAGLTLAGLDAMRSGYEEPVAFPLWADGGVVGIVPSTVVDHVSVNDRPLVPIEQTLLAWGDFIGARLEEPMAVVIDRAFAMAKAHVLVYNAAGAQVGYLSLEDPRLLTSVS